MYNPAEVAQNVVQIGKTKAALPIHKMILLGIMAGMFIAMAAVGANTAACTMENASLAKLIAGLIFPVGLAMTIIAGSELFTGNTLMIISVLERKVTISQMLKNWLFVYVGNFIGAMLIVILVKVGGQLSLFGGALAVTTIKTAAAKASLSFSKALALGTLCNIAVCIAVWMAYAAKTVQGKIIGLYLPIMVFIVSGYEHSVANMYYIPSGLIALTTPEYAQAAADVANVSQLTWSNFFLHNLIPVTLGNILGGMVIVGMTYWVIYLRKPVRQ